MLARALFPTDYIYMKKNQKGRGPQNGLPPRALGPITTPL